MRSARPWRSTLTARHRERVGATGRRRRPRPRARPSPPAPPGCRCRCTGRARARAAPCSQASSVPSVSRLGDQRARHDDALVDGERHALQPGLAGQVGGGLARGDALRDQRVDGWRPCVSSTRAARPRRRARPAAGPGATAPATPPRRRRWSCHAQTKRPPGRGGRWRARSARSRVIVSRVLQRAAVDVLQRLDVGHDRRSRRSCGCWR